LIKTGASEQGKLANTAKSLSFDKGIHLANAADGLFVKGTLNSCPK